MRVRVAVLWMALVACSRAAPPEKAGEAPAPEAAKPAEPAPPPVAEPTPEPAPPAASTAPDLKAIEEKVKRYVKYDHDRSRIPFAVDREGERKVARLKSAKAKPAAIAAAEAERKRKTEAAEARVRAGANLTDAEIKDFEDIFNAAVATAKGEKASGFEFEEPEQKLDRLMAKYGGPDLVDVLNRYLNEWHRNRLVLLNAVFSQDPERVIEEADAGQKPRSKAK